MNRSTILTVDDTISNLDILVELLDDFEVLEATNGEEALEIVSEEDEIDLILLDIVMPDMNGYEVCTKIKQNPKTKDIPIIFITANDDEDSIEKAYDVGGFDYVRKPFKPKELLARVKTQLKLKQLKHKELEYNKQTALSELIHNIAHQWRQPLSSISTISSGLSMQKEMGMLSDDNLISSCDNISRITDQLSATIENFQSFLNKEMEASIFTIADLIDRNYDMIFSCSLEDLEIVLDIDETIKLTACQNQLMQVLLSLVTNAKDAIKDILPQTKVIYFKCSKKDENNILLELYDSANGIDKEILTRIFEPYFTTKHKSQGKGLGLYMTQTLINQSLNGTIDVYNYEFDHNDTKQKGAKFDITLPI